MLSNEKGKSGISVNRCGCPSTLAQGDVNGDDVADFELLLTGQHILAASDVVL